MKRTLILFAALVMALCTASAQSSLEESLKQHAKEKVAQMLSYISRMADKRKTYSSRRNYRTKALNLYIGAGNSYPLNGVRYDPVKMQVTSTLTGRKNDIFIRDYFTNLINLKYSEVKITYTEVADMKVSDLQQINDTLFECTVQYVQVFQGYRDGSLLYADKTVKRVVCFVQKEQTIDGEEYVTLLGDTHCDQTEPL